MTDEQIETLRDAFCADVMKVISSSMKAHPNDGSSDNIDTIIAVLAHLSAAVAVRGGWQLEALVAFVRKEFHDMALLAQRAERAPNSELD